MKLNVKPVGTYVDCKYCEENDNFFQDFTKYLNKWSIPNPIDVKELHSTILYSRTQIDTRHWINYNKMQMGLRAWSFRPTGFDIYGNTLVLLLDAPQLTDLHNKFIKLGGTCDYESYNPHVTLSYDIGNYDISKLLVPKFKFSPIVIYTEPLELDWKKK